MIEDSPINKKPRPDPRERLREDNIGKARMMAERSHEAHSSAAKLRARGADLAANQAELLALEDEKIGAFEYNITELAKGLKVDQINQEIIKAEERLAEGKQNKTLGRHGELKMKIGLEVLRAELAKRAG